MRQSTCLAWLGAALLAVSAHAAEVVKVGSTPGVTSDAVQALVPEARAAGIDLQLVEFTDWTLPNEAVNNGDIDLNFFQHQAFLNNAVKERGYQLAFIGLGLLQNIGIYSNRYQRLADVPEKARVAVANDPVNQGRGLLLLQKAGLITLRNGSAVGASVHDVVENPKKLRFFEIEGPQLIRALDDLDLVVVWPAISSTLARRRRRARRCCIRALPTLFMPWVSWPAATARRTPSCASWCSCTRTPRP